LVHTQSLDYMTSGDHKIRINCSDETGDTVSGETEFMITYDNKIVVTPYYANSDGRTRSWTEVWGGTIKPWLVSVKAKYDTMYTKKDVRSWSWNECS